jgi:hypothetical protein
MKNNLKKIELLFVLLFAVFYSCEKDLYEGAFKPESNQKANVRTSSLKELFKDKEFVLSYKKFLRKVLHHPNLVGQLLRRIMVLLLLMRLLEL